MNRARKRKANDEKPLRLLTALIITWGGWRAFEFWNLAPGLKHLRPAAWARFSIIGFLIFLAWIWMLAPGLLGKALRAWFNIRRFFGKWRWLFVPLIAVGIPFAILWTPTYSKIASKHTPTDAVVVWSVAYLLTAFATALFLAKGEQGTITPRESLISLLLPAAAFAFLEAYTHVSSYPFSLSWSEGNRIWDYSLMFGRKRYLYPLSQPISAHIDAGRQFLWGLIFLIPGVGIFGVRLWSAVMFTVPYLLFAFTAFWKPNQARKAGVIAALWAFLFLRQGPIYTPLLLSAWLILLAVDSPLWLGVILAIGSGYLAAVSRFTWVLAPFAWSAMLTVGAAREKADLRAAGTKFAWLGTAALIGSFLSGSWQTLFATLTGMMQRFLYGRSTLPAHGDFAAGQPLIWGRLFPNPTFQPGILLGVLIAVLPLLILLEIWRRRGLWRLHRTAIAVDAISLLAFLGGGVLISLKIGGGSNLHNLDMFLISLLFVVVIAWRQGVWKWVTAVWTVGERWALVLLILAPVYFVFLSAHPRHIPEQRWWKPDLRAIQHFVHQAQGKPGEILFMDQRQLLTFGFVKGVPLVPDYEKKLMMDEAMAGDKEYFARYYHDLASKRFSLIVGPVLKVNYQKEGSHNFASENNAWIRWVAAPTLCYYKPIYSSNLGFAIYVPRTGHVDCATSLPVAPAK